MNSSRVSLSFKNAIYTMFFLSLYSYPIIAHDCQDYQIVQRSSYRLHRKSLAAQDSYLDLHRLTQKQAYKASLIYINDAYTKGKKTCQIMTGKGNHVHPDGRSGILRARFPEWMETPAITSFVQSYHFDEPNGTYIVTLKKLKRKMNKRDVLLPSQNHKSIWSVLITHKEARE